MKDSIEWNDILYILILFYALEYFHANCHWKSKKVYVEKILYSKICVLKNSMIRVDTGITERGKKEDDVMLVLKCCFLKPTGIIESHANDLFFFLCHTVLHLDFLTSDKIIDGFNRTTHHSKESNVTKGTPLTFFWLTSWITLRKTNNKIFQFGNELMFILQNKLCVQEEKQHHQWMK